MGGMSWIHWVVVLLIVIIVFGTKKLRNIGQDLGGAVKGFKEGMKDGTAEQPAQPSQPAEQVGHTFEGEAKKEKV